MQTKLPLYNKIAKLSATLHPRRLMFKALCKVSNLRYERCSNQTSRGAGRCDCASHKTKQFRRLCSPPLESKYKASIVKRSRIDKLPPLDIPKNDPNHAIKVDPRSSPVMKVLIVCTKMECNQSRG